VLPFAHGLHTCPRAGQQGLEVGISAFQGPPSALLTPLRVGLKRIHVLTVQGSYELRVDLEDFDNGTAFAHYGSFGVGLFSVDPEEDGYPISISDYSGTAGRAPQGTKSHPQSIH